MDRAPDLHVSALSPAEFRAYKRYLDLLALAQARDGVTTLGADGTVRFERVAVRRFAEERLGARGVDEVLSRVATAGARLSAGQVYAVFRLLSHQVAGKRGDIELVFVPVDPLPLDPDAPAPPPPRRVHSISGPVSAASSSSSRRSRPSLPPRRTPSPPPSRASRKSLPNSLDPKPLDPFADSPGPSPAKARTYSTPALGTSGIVGSNNPFRATAPHLGWGKPPAQQFWSSGPAKEAPEPPRSDLRTEPLRSVGPPLPPRKPSVRRPGPALPPRGRVRADSLSSSASENQPTSTRESSSIMQQSFAAAANREQPRRTATVQVLRSSERPAPPQRPDDANDSLSTRNEPPPPPRRDEALAPPRRDEALAGHPRRDIVEQVSRAIRESEVDPPPPPPQRVVSGARPKPSPSPTSATAAFTLTAEEARAKYPGLKTWPHVGLLSDRPSRQAFAMIILNQPITRRDTLMRVWFASTLRYCADGGANRLYDALDAEERERMLPTMIKGDLDSIRPDVKAFYASRGVAIKRDPSEYATDLQKNMDEVVAVEKASGKKFSLVFLGGLSGRLDQTLHVLSTLFKLRETRRSTYVISEESLAWVLDTGVHLIEIDHASMGQTCGLLPVGVNEAYVRTEGLRWNLDWATSVMGDLSTSNHLLPHEHAVLVDTSAPIVWTVEIRKGLQMPPLRSPTGVDELSRGVKELGRAVGKGMGSIGQGFNRRLSRQGVPMPANTNGGEERRERNERAALVQQDSGYASRDDEADGYAQLD
ncbi:hypothetical protein CC85DRAFT_272444 [Cutaneotrichosporon oleaginosum]|uniref:Thiamin pyrophosphokinase thiamin-binding domain-containing protein n=1 Tax=Cutaneotrichosporon oleaginosum TaxID=879819 RepID=A0A0J0XQW7_9TREE|nr:uncharacterized protein CC85DRAFT_272444 [Cutaneotrichosporon oleaginosum]KLT43477.1 hypothetical protein CC85DRAFT_272444 [Cutaneotrichosporon oleaginosum]TXT05620.1 hypothetical protein COLE_06940 [Cutaneotrichosporon oleaginosum]